jgi:hypothetical protein
MTAAKPSPTPAPEAIQLDRIIGTCSILLELYGSSSAVYESFLDNCLPDGIADPLAFMRAIPIHVTQILCHYINKRSHLCW